MKKCNATVPELYRPFHFSFEWCRCGLDRGHGGDCVCGKRMHVPEECKGSWPTPTRFSWL